MIRTVRKVAVETTVHHRSVFPEKRTALLGVALVTQLVHRVGTEQRLGDRAVGVVAVRAGDLALVEGHVGAFSEVHPLLGMAGEAGARGATSGLEIGNGVFADGVVAVAAGEIQGFVGGAHPVDAFATRMARETSPVHALHGGARGSGETLDQFRVEGIFDVDGAIDEVEVVEVELLGGMVMCLPSAAPSLLVSLLALLGCVGDIGICGELGLDFDSTQVSNLPVAWNCSSMVAPDTSNEFAAPPLPQLGLQPFH